MSTLPFVALLILGQANGNSKLPPRLPPLPAASHNDSAFFDLTSLITRDWSNDEYALSLQSEERSGQGNGWFFRYDGRVRAWKGKYEFFALRDRKSEAVLLRIGFQRCYDLHVDQGKPKWVLRTSYHPEGMRMEIPLENERVPNNVVQFSVVSGFWSDEDGAPMTRTRRADGILGNVLGLEKEMEIRSLEHVKLGDTLSLSDTPHPRFLDLIVDYPPPGYKAHITSANQQPMTALKPIEPFSPASILMSNRFLAVGFISQANKERRFDEALRACNEALRQSRDNHFVWYLRGQANEGKGNDKEAIEDFSYALSIKANEQAYFWRRGRVYERLKSYEAAVKDYRKCAEIDPTDAAAFNAAAWNLAVRKVFSDRQAADALDFARKAGQLTNFKNYIYLDTLAAAYARRGDFGPATRAQAEAVRLAVEKDKEDYTSRLRLYESGRPYFD